MKKEKERVLAEASLYRFLSLSFTYPDQETVKTLQSLTEDMEEVLSCLSLNIPNEFQAYKRSIHQISEENLQGEYTELFMTRMLCPPYETSYGKNRLLLIQNLWDITAFYKAFGFSLSGKDREKHDHIAVEWEFLTLLSLKEAYGIEKGKKDMVEICGSAKKKFLQDHLARWIRAFLKNLRERSLLPVL